MWLIDRDADRPYRGALAFVFFAVIAFGIMTSSGYLDFIDGTFVSVVQKTQNGFNHGLYSLITTLGSPKMAIIYTAVLAFFLWGFRHRIAAVWAILTIISGDAVAAVVKTVVHRARPLGHLASDDGFSFPSGHVFGMFLVIAMVWILILPQFKTRSTRVIIKLLMIVIMFLLAVSRVYLNAHYPSDTVGAMLLGYVWLQIAESLYVHLAPGLSHWPLLKKSDI